MDKELLSMTYTTKIDPLKLLRFNSEEEYRASNIFSLISEEVLERDKYKCQSKLCQSNAPASEIVFLHRTLAAYLGIGCFNLFSFCKECSAQKLDPCSLLFMVSGLRPYRGKSRNKIGLWYTTRFKENRETALKIYNRLSERNRKYIQQLIEAKLLGAKESYKQYLGLA
jgi:hypothetical protein